MAHDAFMARRARNFIIKPVIGGNPQAAIHRKIAGFQRDEVYIGTAEERAKQAMEDGDAPIGAGHPVKLPGFSENAPKSLKKLLAKDASVKVYLNEIADKMDKADA